MQILHQDLQLRASVPRLHEGDDLMTHTTNFIERSFSTTTLLRFAGLSDNVYNVNVTEKRHHCNVQTTALALRVISTVPL